VRAECQCWHFIKFQNPVVGGEDRQSSSQPEHSAAFSDDDGQPRPAETTAPRD